MGGTVITVTNELAEKTLYDPVKKASGIVSECLVSFGAGYAVQAERESPVKGYLPDPGNLPPNPPPIVPPQIFGDYKVLQKFQLLALAGCIENRDELPWGALDQQRKAILRMAFLHGMFARRLMTERGDTTISPEVLAQSLDIVQHWCMPDGSGGGGPACPFKLT
jgi:hypothetical protein